MATHTATQNREAADITTGDYCFRHNMKQLVQQYLDGVLSPTDDGNLQVFQRLSRDLQITHANYIRSKDPRRAEVGMVARFHWVKVGVQKPV